MKSNIRNFFEVDWLEFPQGQALPFPTYVYLKLNDRYVPFTEVDAVFGDNKRQKLRASERKMLLVPEQYREVYLEYLKSLSPEASQVPAMTGELNLAEEIITAGNLSDTAKEVLLSEIGARCLDQDLPSQFDLLTKSDSFISQINNLLDEVYRQAAVEVKLFEMILQIKQLKSPTDFSLFSTLICFMLAMNHKIAKPVDLATICTAALFRDTGFFTIAESFLAQSKLTWNPANTKKYQEHVKDSLKHWQLISENLPESIATFMEQHHENYNGTGFPKKIWHHQITREAQIIHLADEIALLVRGLNDGKKYSVRSALEKIQAETKSEDTIISPEIIFHGITSAAHGN